MPRCGTSFQPVAMAGGPIVLAPACAPDGDPRSGHECQCDRSAEGPLDIFCEFMLKSFNPQGK
jgi:hypothetical protein